MKLVILLLAIAGGGGVVEQYGARCRYAESR